MVEGPSAFRQQATFGLPQTGRIDWLRPMARLGVREVLSFPDRLPAQSAFGFPLGSME